MPRRPFPNFPAWKYHRTLGTRFVNNEQEFAELLAADPGWSAQAGEVSRAIVEESLSNAQNRAALARQAQRLRERQSMEKS